MDTPILLISGTNRPGSNALKIARVVEAHYHQAGAAVSLFSLADLPPEMFHPDSYARKSQAVVDIQQRILAAPGLHIVTPEYNGSFPGVLKYFIDMLKFPESFERKPVALVGESVSPLGAIRAVEHLHGVFAYRNGLVFPERVYIPSVSQKVDTEGRLTDPQINERLAKQVQGFVHYIQTLHHANIAIAH